MIISLVMFIIMSQSATISKPVSNGLTLKLKPISVKEEFKVKPKSFGALFARVPQELTNAAAASRREILSKAHFSHASEIGVGCTNQIAKIPFPLEGSQHNSLVLDTKSMNMPLLQQPFEKYKIVVATAPAHMKISGTEETPLVVYIVFSEDESSNPNSINIPSIYFVKKPVRLPLINKTQSDPILIVDSNRTVTGLKSKEVAKFVKFKNKLINRNNYEVDRR